MIPYQTKTKKIKATRFKEIWKEAQAIYSQIKKRTKRRPYIRSAYFRKQKIFFDYFWKHLAEKSPRLKRIRLKYFSLCYRVNKEISQCS